MLEEFTSILKRRMQGLSFPYSKPTWPGSVERPLKASKLGVNYDSAWSRRYFARLARAGLIDWVARPAIGTLAPVRVHGVDYLDSVDGPVIFAGNHSSHLDTVVLLASLPDRFRHRCLVAAGADYFFDKTFKAHLWSLATGAIPIERNRVDRKSANLAIELIDQGWNLIIFPEGGRSPDGWTQSFKPGVSYLAKKTGVPIVPVYLHGTRQVLPKDSKRITHGATKVVFGEPLHLEPDEDLRDFATRIETKVYELAHETDESWWKARQGAARGTTPNLNGPKGSNWRRSWELKARDLDFK